MTSIDGKLLPPGTMLNVNILVSYDEIKNRKPGTVRANVSLLLL
jgi:hypothetical protein